MQERIRRQIGIEWWLVYFWVMACLLLYYPLSTPLVCSQRNPPESSCFFKKKNMLLITHTLWPQPKHEINWKCKWKPATIESSTLRFSIFFFFYNFVFRQQTRQNFLFFVTASKGKYLQRLAVTLACLHFLFASHLCTGNDLIRPVHQSLRQFGCMSHSEGGEHILVQRCSGLNVSVHDSQPRWDEKTPTNAKVKTKVQEEPRDSHIYNSDNNVFFFYYLSAPSVLTLKHCGPSAAQYKCCYRLFLHLYKHRHAIADYTKASQDEADRAHVRTLWLSCGK